MRSTMSALVIVMAASAPQFEREAGGQVVPDTPVRGIDLVVGERALWVAIGDRVGAALLARRDGRAAVAIEAANRLDQRISYRSDLLEDRCSLEGIVHDHRDVATHGRKSRHRSEPDAARTIVSDLLEVKL